MSIDAASAVNSVNSSNLEGYFQNVVDSMLSPLDCLSADGTICKYINVAYYGRRDVKFNMGTAQTSATIFDFDHIDSYSGATSHMCRNNIDFEDDSVTYNDVLVLMGDNFQITVLGYSTSRVKINGHVVCLVNSLHVTDLDIDLFSCTRHGSNWKGNTFFVGEGKMQLLITSFTITDNIPKKGDLKVLIEPLTEDDWGIPNFICDGIRLQNTQLENFATRSSFLDNVL